MRRVVDKFNSGIVMTASFFSIGAALFAIPGFWPHGSLGIRGLCFVMFLICGFNAVNFWLLRRAQPYLFIEDNVLKLHRNSKLETKVVDLRDVDEFGINNYNPVNGSAYVVFRLLKRPANATIKKAMWDSAVLYGQFCDVGPRKLVAMLNCYCEEAKEGRLEDASPALAQ